MTPDKVYVMEIIKTVLLALSLISGPLLAQESTNHTSLHRPIDDARATFQKEGCLDAKTVVVSNFVKTRRDKSVFDLDGADYEIRFRHWSLSTGFNF